MVYQQDYQAVRDAKDQLDEAIYNDQIGKLDDQIDSLNDQLDAIDEKYDKLIEDTEKFYDEQIKGIEKMIDKWEEISEKLELAEAIAALSVFGITMEDVLNGNTEAFNMLEQGMVGCTAGLTNNLDSIAQAFGTTTDQITALKASVLGYTDAATGELSNVADAAKDATGAVTGTTTSEDADAEEGTDGLSTALSDLNENVDLSNVEEQLNGEEESVKVSALDAANSIKAPEDSDDPAVDTSIEDTTLTAIEEIPKVTHLFELLEQMINLCVQDVNNLGEGMENLPSLPTGTKSSSTPKTTVFDKYTGVSRAIGQNQALVGELGSELVAHKNGTFDIVGGHGAEFTNIRNDDIVFDHLQTRSLLKNGHINSRGKAYAYGKLPSGFSPLQSEELRKYQSLNTVQDITEKLSFGNNKLMNIDKNVAMMMSDVHTVNNNSNPIINVTNPTFTCTGVTGEEVLRQIESQFTGLFVNAYQRSMK